MRGKEKRVGNVSAMTQADVAGEWGVRWIRFGGSNSQEANGGNIHALTVVAL
jgi:hypothetical protein